MNTPTHAEIARQAEYIWRTRGCPPGLDSEIWLEAEQQLSPGTLPAENPKPFTERASAETAAESVVEYQISPAGSEQEAIRAAIQNSESAGPKINPPKAGKPDR